MRLLCPAALVVAALLAAAPSALAEPGPGVCEYDAATKTATYKWPTSYSASAVPAAQRFGAGNEQISVGTAADTACGLATVLNTDTIRIIGTPPTNNSYSDDFALALQNGLIVPGATDEAGTSDEIEIQFVNPGRMIRLRITGTGGDDVFTAGVDGANLNANETTKDLDVSTTGTGSKILTQEMGCWTTTTCGFGQDLGSPGNDTLSVQGGDGTGGPLNGQINAQSALIGGPGNDTLRGTSDTNFNPGTGNDTIIGPTPLVTGFSAPWVSYHEATNPITVNLTTGTASGADIGSDTITNVPDVSGGRGGDTITGDGAPNSLSGYAYDSPDGDDTISGMGGGDSLSGNVGNDTINGNDGNDSLAGGPGNDTLNGGADNDGAVGDVGESQIGNDTIDLGPGDDTTTPGRGNDTVIGGPGTDGLNFFYLTAGVTFDLAITTPQVVSPGMTKTVSGVENVGGTQFGDLLYGDEGPNVMNGAFDSGATPNVDRIEGRGGKDQLAIYSKQAGSVIEGGEGEDSVSVSASPSAGVTLRGGPGKDYVSGDEGPDVLDGGPGEDSIFGREGDDALTGGVDGVKDSLNCGAGTDSAIFDSGLDLLTDCETGSGAVVPPTADPPVADPPPTPPVTGASPPGQTTTAPVLAPLPQTLLELPKPGKAKCVSRRDFAITLGQAPGVTYGTAKVTLKAGGKTLVKTLKPKKAGKRWKVQVDLKGLPKGSFTVEIVVTTSDGRTLKGKRTYKTCAKKQKSSGKPEV
ncbi:MAG: hypothetical protein JHC95_20575 [Solirubrobacteraceae bacterium]|nr:hypothetical protein [Solirubrobacteraceae bacterium]